MLEMDVGIKVQTKRIVGADRCVCPLFSNSLRNFVARPSLRKRDSLSSAREDTRNNCPSFDKEGRAQRREFEITHRCGCFHLGEHTGSPLQA